VELRRPTSLATTLKQFVPRAGLVAAVLVGGRAAAQQVDPELWITDGPVYAVAESNGTVYIGGLFTRVAPATGGGAALDATSGEPVPSFSSSSRVLGEVFAVAPDGSGGWYIGGRFTHVGGKPRSNLAHLGADLSVSAWNPSANGWVYALAVSGSTVYVGGTLTAVGGQPRSCIAALDAVTGAVTAWDPNATGWSPTVEALLVDGSTIYVGGFFTGIGGQPRNEVAALDAVTGSATAWNPNPSPGSHVYALAVSGSTVFVGGTFTDMGGQPRDNLAAVDATTGAATAWVANTNINRRVSALVVGGPNLYVGGWFSTIAGRPRNNIAALDVGTGAAIAY
jgi:hypothetical protein